MVRTGKRATALIGLFTAAGLKPDAVQRPAPRIENLDPAMGTAVLDVYRTLGGRLDHPVFRPGAWDLSMDGILIELDEELHFNRYRAVTLQQDWARDLPWTTPYLDLCRTREPECLNAATWGKRWTSDPSARMFGEAAPPGDLSTNAGAPRWKQRALYDAVKDSVAARGEGVRVARLSVYDEVSGRLLGDVLAGREALDIDDLLELVSSRTS